MKLSFAFAALAVALGAVAQNGPRIETPSGAQQCAPILLSVSGGTPPYQIDALPGGQTGATPIETITSNLNAQTFTWNVDLQSGTSVTLRVRDSTGAINFSDIVTIQPNSNTSCLNGGSSSSGSSSGSSTGAAGGSSTSGAPTTSGSAPTSSASSTPATAVPTGASTGATGTSKTSGSTTSTGTRPSSTASTSSTSTGSAAQSSGSSAAVGLKAGSAAGVVGALLAYVLA